MLIIHENQRNQNGINSVLERPSSLGSRYSYRSATIGSTLAALLAGIQHARKLVASNNKTVLAKVAGS